MGWGAARSAELNQAIGRLYDMLTGHVSWDEAMEGVVRAARAERLTLNTMTPDGAFRVLSFPFEPEGALAYAQDYAGQDLRVPRILAGRRGVLATQDLMSAEEIARCPVHNELYRRYPECWNQLIVATETDGTIHAPSFQRGARYGLYDAEEARAIDLLSQHVVRAGELSRRLSAAAVSSEGIVAALDGLAEGLIVLDEAGQVAHMNMAARHIVAERDGIELVNGTPVASHRASRPAFARLLAATLLVASRALRGFPAPLTLPRPSGGRPLKVQGFASPHDEAGMRMAVLTVAEEGEWRLPDLDTLRAAAGLTPAEAKVARALMEGLTVRQYADAAGLSEHTVRFQLKRVREKLGVGSQSAVVSALMRICGQG